MYNFAHTTKKYSINISIQSRFAWYAFDEQSIFGEKTLKKTKKSNLGKPVCTIIDEFLEKFQKGGAVISDPKISLQNF